MSLRANRAEALLVAGLALLVATLLLGVAGRVAEDPLLQLGLHAAVTEVLILGVALASARLTRRGPQQALGWTPGRLRWRDVALLAAGTLAASHALDGIARRSGAADDGPLAALPEILAGAEGVRLLAALLSVGLAPAVAEELLCRGLIQRALVRRVGAAAGIGGAALVFGALHVDPLHASFATLLGLYLGLAAHWDDSSRAPIVCHALNNSAGVLALAAAGGTSAQASPASIAGGAVLALACLLLVARVHPDRGPVPAGPETGAGPGRAGGLQPGRGSDDA